MQHDDTEIRADDATTTEVENVEPSANRRETLAAIAKFAAFVAPMTVVLVSAEQAKAHTSVCSTRPWHRHCF